MISFPECIEKFNVNARVNTRKLLSSIREIRSMCKEDDVCMEKLIKSFEHKEVAELYNLFNSHHLPLANLWQISTKYFSAMSFITIIFHKNDIRKVRNVTNIVDNLTGEEQNFIVTLATNRMNFLLHYTDDDTCTKSAVSMKDNETLNQIFKKVNAARINLSAKNFKEIYQKENIFKLIRNNIELIASSQYFRSPDFKEAPLLFKWWISFCLNHPEFAEKVNDVISQDQSNLFIRIIRNYFYCVTSKNQSADICVKNVMKHAKSEDVDDILEVFEYVKEDLSSDKSREVSSKYNRVLNFLANIFDKLHSFEHLSIKNGVAKFTEDEKNWMVILVEKWITYILRYSDINALVDAAKFMTDNELLDQIDKKLIQEPN